MTSSALVRTLVSKLPTAKPGGNGWTALCPAHEDSSPSLSIWEGRDGRAMFNCHAGCPKETILARVGLSWADVSPPRAGARNRVDAGAAKRTVYRIPHNGRIYEHVRVQAPAGKTFSWVTDGRNGLQGTSVADLPLYRSDRLANGDEPVFIVEGEKAADGLSRLAVSVVSTYGAGTAPSAASLAPLTGRRVFLWPDKDAPGHSHMEKVGKGLQGIAASISVVRWPEAPPKGDAADFVARGGTADQLAPLVAAAEEFIPSRSLEWSGKETNPAPRGRFRPRTIGEMAAETPVEIDWLVDRLIPSGSFVLLSALMKAGKTTLAYALVAALVGGRPFLGMRTTKTPVLILAVEEHRRDVLRRLRKFGVRDSDPVFVHSGLLEADQDFAAIKAFVAEQKIGLVLVDTWSRYAAVADENDNSEALRKASPLLDLSRETGATVMLVHHDRKSGGEDGRSIRGAGALLGLVDQALMLSRRETGPRSQRILKVLGRYEDSPPETVVDFDGTEYTSLGPPGQADTDAARDRISAALTADPQEIPALATKAGISEKVVRRVIGSMEVEKTGSGHKGDPFRYRLQNSFPPRSTPMVGQETNSSETLAEEYVA